MSNKSSRLNARMVQKVRQIILKLTDIRGISARISQRPVAPHVGYQDACASLLRDPFGKLHISRAMPA
jgi:hypothetical protein